MRGLLSASLWALALLAAPHPAALAATGAVAEAQPRDPAALDALSAMGNALRAKTSFAVQANVTTEEVLQTGQKLQRGGVIDLVVQRPNGFAATIRDGRQDRDLYYDGRTFTVFAPELGHYATFDAPGTIAETLDRARSKYGIEVPLADLFLWGTADAPVDRIQSAVQLGDDYVGGQRCIHYAMRQDMIDWQIWINEAGSLPCKLVITSKSDPAMPQFTAVYAWRDSSPLPSNFQFVAPQGASKIAFRDANK